MPKLEEHCWESVALFGEPFTEIHLWPDEFAGTEKYGMWHRCVRHHEAGIAEACRLFGPRASEAARQHIVADLKTEGWTTGDPFPKNEDDYRRMGLF